MEEYEADPDTQRGLRSRSEYTVVLKIDGTEKTKRVSAMSGWDRQTILNYITSALGRSDYEVVSFKEKGVYERWGLN